MFEEDKKQSIWEQPKKEYNVFDATEYSVYNNKTKTFKPSVSNVFNQQTTKYSELLHNAKVDTTKKEPTYSLGNLMEDFETTDPIHLGKEQLTTIGQTLKDTMYSYALIPAANYGEWISDMTGWEEGSEVFERASGIYGKEYKENRDLLIGSVGEDPTLRALARTVLEVKDGLNSMATFGLAPASGATISQMVVAYGIPYGQEFSSKYSEVKAKTGNKWQATWIATADASFSTLTEYLFSGNRYLGAIEDWGTKPIGHLIGSNVSEILQETLQGWGTNLIDKYGYDKGRNFYDGTIETIVNTGLVTTIASWALRGSKGQFNTRKSIEARIKYLESKEPEAFKQSTQAVMKNSDMSEEEAKKVVGSLLTAEHEILNRISKGAKKMAAISKKTEGKKPAFAGKAPEYSDRYQKLKAEAIKDTEAKIMTDKSLSSLKKLQQNNAIKQEVTKKETVKKETKDVGSVWMKEGDKGLSELLAKNKMTEEKFVDSMLKWETSFDSLYKEASEQNKQVIERNIREQKSQEYSDLYNKLSKKEVIKEPKQIAPEAPVVPLETIVTPEQAKPTVEPVITKEVQLLKQEAKKYKSAEEFAMSQGALTTDTLYQDKKQLLEYIKNKKDLDWDSISDELHSLSIFSTDLNKAQSILENDVKETEKLLKKEQQLTDIWNKVQTTIKDSGYIEEYNKPTVVTKTKEVIAKKELPKITAIQQKSTKVTKAQIDRTIRPTSDKISLTKKAGVKLNIRIQKAATKKVLASGRELRKKLISELKAEGFTPKQIQGEINNILKVNTQDRLEATKRKIIIKLEGTRRQQIDLDIRPKSETITKTISYLNKNRFRLLSKDVHKTIVSTVKSKNKLIRDLRAEGFSIKEIAKNFRKILRANTPETMELARQATIKSLTEQREFQVAKEKVQAETKLKKQLIKSIKKTSKDLIHTKLTDTNLEKFKELTDAITFSKPTAKTISKLTKTKKFLDGLLDSTDIAPNILDTLRQSIVRLEQKSLSEFTIPELVELNKSIKILQAQDSLIKTIKRGNIIRARDAVNKTANNQLRKLKQDTTKEKIKFGELSPLDSVTNMLGSQAKNYWNTMINPTTYASKVFKAPIQSELLDFIKQRTLGEQTLSMYDPWAIAGGYDFIAAENELTGLNNNFINWKNNLEISGKDSVVTGGVTNRNTYKLTSGKTLNITNAEKVSLVVYSKNIKSLKRLEHIAIKVGPGYDKYALSQTDIKNIKDSLAPKELEWVNKSIELTKTYAEQINKVSNRTEGYSLAKEANYMRMRILGVDGKEWLQDINQSMLSNKSINKATAKSKIGKQRTGSTKGFLVVDDFIKNLQNYHRDATAYIVYSEPIRNMEMLLKSTKDNMLSVKDGDKVYEGMNSFLQDMKSRVYEWDSVSIVAKKVLNIVRSNIMKANISMMLMQPASLLSVPLFIPEKYIVSATAEALVDFKKTIKLMEKYSPLAYTRYENQMLNYEISEFMMSNYNTAKNLKKQLGTFLMKPVSEADKLTTAIIWKAIAKMVDAKYPELSQEQRNIITAREWEIIIAKSQPSHHISTRSSLGRSSNPFIKGLLAFKSVTNKNLNILVESTKNKSQFLKALLYIVAGMSVFRATQKATVRKLYRKEKTTPKQFISDMAFAPLGMFYFTGDAIMSIKSKIERGIYSGWDYNTLLGTTLDSSVDAIALIFKLVMQDGNEIVKSGKNKGKTKRSVLIKSLITKGSQLFGLVTGLPITNLLRTYNATQTWMDEPTSKVKSNLYSVPKAPKAPKAPTFKAPKVPTFKAPKFKAPKF